MQTQNQLHHNNNFGLLRLLAAFFVVISHSYGFLDKGLDQPILKIGDARFIASDIGLFIFFTISGYLVTQSICTSRSISHYFWKRLLRIVPALFVVNLACIVMGVFVTRLSVTDYLFNKETWNYLLFNSTLVVHQYSLPGVFEELKKNTVNGSLWTILVEVKFYILLALAALLRLLKLRWLLLGLFFLCMLVKSYLPLGEVGPLRIDLFMYATFGTYFFMGLLFYLFRNKLSFHIVGSVVLLLLSVLITHPPTQGFIMALLFAYSTILIGRQQPVVDLKGNDFSYGFYLYAFPIQILVLLWLGAATPVWLHIMISSALALAAAILSWYLIEKPALRKKDIFVQKKT